MPGAPQVASPERVHRHECLLRWADVDPLGHVNNVAYAEYLQEAHEALLRRRCEPAGGAAARDELQPAALRYEVTFLAPLMLAARSVEVECRATQGSSGQLTIASELAHSSLDSRMVVARSSALFGTRGRPPTRARDAFGDRHHTALQVRRSDVDGAGRLGDVGCFEYLQEARIQLIAELGIDPTATVVAQKDVDLFGAPALAAEGIDVWSWVSRVGGRSTTIESTVMSGDDELAHGSVTLVFFSPQLQKSVSPSPDVLAALRSRVPSAPA
nr:thioesterase family protein [Nocardioides ginsengisegetis]